MNKGFSPRNGEVILKFQIGGRPVCVRSFSPLNGEVILKKVEVRPNEFDYKFQSPQWGSNSKGVVKIIIGSFLSFSPLNGEVILK